MSDSFIQAVNTRKFDTFSPPPSSLPFPPEEWAEKELSMDFLKKQILKKIHKLIKTYPGKYCSNQISKILELDFDGGHVGDHKGYTAMRATNELVKKGYIRQTSAGGFVVIKPLVK